MIDAKIEDALDDQIRMEFASAYLYLSMVAYFEDENLPGFAHWMRLQAREEKAHAMRLFDFVLDRGGRPELDALEKPSAEFDSPRDVAEKTLAHEQAVTQSIHEIYRLAVEEGDYATESEMAWFVDEQVEEEKSAEDLLADVRRAGDDSAALLMLDRELGQRAPGEDEEGGSEG